MCSISKVTTYTHKDDNNKWLVKKFRDEPDDSGVQLLRHGNIVVLEHIVTRRNLHSHREPAPVTKKHLQVTGYGEVICTCGSYLFKINWALEFTFKYYYLNLLTHHKKFTYSHNCL